MSGGSPVKNEQHIRMRKIRPTDITEYFVRRQLDPVEVAVIDKLLKSITREGAIRRAWLREIAEAITEVTSWKPATISKEKAEAYIAYVAYYLYRHYNRMPVDVFVVCKVATIVMFMMGERPPYRALCGIRVTLQPFNPFYLTALKSLSERGVIKIVWERESR